LFESRQITAVVAVDNIFWLAKTGQVSGSMMLISDLMDQSNDYGSQLSDQELNWR
jgi:Co/Zn/Cd efflux system component